MGNKDKNIKNEIAYFNKVIKNMEINEKMKKSYIKKHEIKFNEIIYDNFLQHFNMDKYIESKSLLGWVDIIENEDLHKAVKGLSEEDQIFISYIFKDCLTQKELAIKYKMSQANISYKFKKILRIIRNNLHKN